MTRQAVPPSHPLWGSLGALLRDPLDFLTECARSGDAAVPMRLLHRPALLVLDPSDIERVLVTSHRDFVKPGWLSTGAVRRLLGDGLVAADGERWRRQRRMCQPAFHLRRMDRYGEAVSSLARETLAGWGDGRTIRLQREMSRLTLEVIARTLLETVSPEWTEPAADAMDLLMARFASPIGLFGMAPLPPGPAELRAAGRLNRIVDALIADGVRSCASATTDSPDDAPLLAMLRRPRDEGGEGLSGRALRDQVKTFLGAGYESSALTLTWAFIMLSRHPAADAALADELALLDPARTAYTDTQRLVYTNAVVKETLRMYPPLWMTGRQAVTACRIGGVRAPAGALMLTSQWAVHRRADLFHCPNEFRPERWLNGETDTLHRFAFFPFGGGPRVCIGQSFAMMETVLLLAAIAGRFRLEVDPEADIRPWATMTLRPRSPVAATLVDRRSG